MRQEVRVRISVGFVHAQDAWQQRFLVELRNDGPRSANERYLRTTGNGNTSVNDRQQKQQKRTAIRTRQLADTPDGQAGRQFMRSVSWLSDSVEYIFTIQLN